MVNIFVLNIKRDNWHLCVKHKIFGIRVGSPTPAINPGDILLARILKNGTNEYGVKGIWSFREYEEVSSETFVPWKDAKYSTLIHFEPLILELKGIFSEQFKGKESKKIRGLSQIRLNASVVSLKPLEAQDYLQGLVSELGDELEINVNYNGRKVNLKTLLKDIANKLGKAVPLQPSSLDKYPKNSLSADIFGERINAAILNYAPLNELGVVLLFGFYMKELGFSHLEQIRTEFPDAIGMQYLPNNKLRRVKIEFEYESKNFEQHNHNPDQCDIIVCWVHNWKNCPSKLQVIELKSFIEKLSRI